MATITRKRVFTPKGPAPGGFYSQAIVADRTLYVSGQLGLNPETKTLVDGGVEAQTKQALTNMGYILEAAGSGFSKVVKVTVLLADIKDFQKMNQVYMSFFPNAPPARAAYQVAALPLGGQVEIEAVALVGDVKDE